MRMILDKMNVIRFVITCILLMISILFIVIAEDYNRNSYFSILVIAGISFTICIARPYLSDIWRSFPIVLYSAISAYKLIIRIFDPFHKYFCEILISIVVNVILMSFAVKSLIFVCQTDEYYKERLWKMTGLTLLLAIMSDPFFLRLIKKMMYSGYSELNNDYLMILMIGEIFFMCFSFYLCMPDTIRINIRKLTQYILAFAMVEILFGIEMSVLNFEENKRISVLIIAIVLSVVEMIFCKLMYVYFYKNNIFKAFNKRNNKCGYDKIINEFDLTKLFITNKIHYSILDINRIRSIQSRLIMISEEKKRLGEISALHGEDDNKLVMILEEEKNLIKELKLIYRIELR